MRKCEKPFKLTTNLTYGDDDDNDMMMMMMMMMTSCCCGFKVISNCQLKIVGDRLYDYSRFIKVYLLRNKYEAFDMFLLYKYVIKKLIK